MNISNHPSRDATQIARKYETVPSTRFLNSPGARVQRAPMMKTLRPPKVAGIHGALLGNLSGGIRVSLCDDEGHRVVAETPVPILADNVWHYLQVTIEGNRVSIAVDRNHLSVSYVKREELVALDWTKVGERVVYPSFDLIAARYRSATGVHDHFCGQLGDIAVEIGRPGGHKLHWWVTDSSKGTIIWDRGSGATQHPQGLHLNLCSCAWDVEDFPATSLLLNGYEGRRALVKALDEATLEKMATAPRTSAGSGSEAITTPPSSGRTPMQLPPPIHSPHAESAVTLLPPTFSARVKSPKSGDNNNNSFVKSPGTATSSLRSPDEPRSLNDMLGNDEDGDSKAPVSQTMNREYFERVAREDDREPMSFSLWVCTRDKDPAIVFTLPLRHPVHLILNLDCKPSVALVNGLDAFVAQCNVTDGNWHHIRWIIDPKTGASLFLNGTLAAWQYVALQVDEEIGAVRGRSNSTSGITSAASMRKVRSTHSFRRSGATNSASGSKRASIADSTSNNDFQDALRRRSLVTSLQTTDIIITTPGGDGLTRRKSSVASNIEGDSGPVGFSFLAGGDRQSWKKNNTSNSEGRGKSNSVAFLDAPRENTVSKVSSGFAADEEELFGDLLDELEEADECSKPLQAAVASTDGVDIALGGAAGDFLADASVAFASQAKPSASLQTQFLLLSIKKRREIIQILTTMMQRAEKRRHAGGNKAAMNDDDDPLCVQCFTLGAYYFGEIREVIVRIGAYTMTWRFDHGTGRSVEGTVVSRYDMMMLGDDQRGGLFTPMHETQEERPFLPFGHQEDQTLSTASSPHCKIHGEMELTGRTVIFPKTTLPYSCPLLDDDVTLQLGCVRLPVAPSSTGLDMDLFVRLRSSHRYGHVITVEHVCILELRKDRLMVFVPSVLDEEMRNMVVAFNPNLSKQVQDASALETPRLVCCASDTTIFEDLHWHHVRIAIPSVGRCQGVRVIVDEIPLELSTSVVMEQFPSGRSERRSINRRGTILHKPSTAQQADASEQAASFDRTAASSNSSRGASLALLSGADGLSSSLPTPLHDTPSASRKANASSGPAELPLKMRLLLRPLSGPLLPAIAHAAHEVQLAAVNCGGAGFSGSVVQVGVVLNGQQYEWPLRDACRTNLARCPPVLEPRFDGHPKVKPFDPSIPMTPSYMDCDGSASPHTHWLPTTLPTKALHFDGFSAFASAVNLRANFSMPDLKRFAVSLWMKAGTTDPSVRLSSGCLFTVHDIRKPITEANCGIFTHTRVDEHTTPKKRVFEPFVTTFLLVDSCARALCFETNFDIYDGLWHKIHWVVFDSEANESHVFIDDMSVSARLVCAEQPREFICRSPVLNLGARNEGDNDVSNYFIGEMRNVTFSRDIGDDILSWPMTEGEGYILNDAYQNICGCVWAPEWIFTPFPPMTPLLAAESIIECSPITDMEATLAKEPVRVTLSIKSNSTSTGVVWSVVSADRCVLASFTVNEGGDHERKMAEMGTHSLRIQRVVQKSVFSAARSPSVLSDQVSTPLISPSAGARCVSPFQQPQSRHLQQRMSNSTQFAFDEFPSSNVNEGSGFFESSVRSNPPLSGRREGKSPQVKKRRIARRGELKNLLTEQKATDDRASVQFLDAPDVETTRGGSNGGGGSLSTSIRSKSPILIGRRTASIRRALVQEERAFQFHYPPLCDGKWHHIVLILPSDPSESDPAVLVDEISMELMHVYTTNLRELPDSTLDEIAMLPPINASNVKDRTPIEVLRDELCWASMVLGQASAGSTPSLYCCLKNFGVAAEKSKTELLFIPFASTMEMTSSVKRDVAATGVQWELSVPPKSCISLGGSRYVVLPPLRRLNLRSFEISFRLRSTSTTPSCILEFGSVDKGYMCIMLNQDAFGDDLPNSIRLCLCDAEGRELHASCFLSEEDLDAEAQTARKRVIDDDQWHRITLRVLDTMRNIVCFEVDGTTPQMRYANCGCASTFHELSCGGTIGALLDVLEPKYSLVGSVKHVTISTILNGPAAAMDPSLPLEREILAFYELTSGFASILTDRSGNRNHAMAVNPVWRTDIQNSWSPLVMPPKATDIFCSSNIYVSRWSNNPSDTVEKNQSSGEVVMDDFPEDGWFSGTKGPQWLSVDLGMTHTVFAIEVDLLRSLSSTHEIFISRSNLSKSSTFHMLSDARNEPVPQCTFLEQFTIRPASPRTMKVHLKHPLWGVRWIRIMAKESTSPVGYAGIRIVAVRGDWNSARKYSVSEALGRTASNLSQKLDSSPMLSMFPDTFAVDGKDQNNRKRSTAKSKAKSNTILWGGEDDGDASRDGDIFASNRSVSESGSRSRGIRLAMDVSTENARADRSDSSSAPRGSLTRSEGEDDIQKRAKEELMQALRKTADVREREMKTLFYTKDVDRTGVVSLVDFMAMFRRADVTGLISEEQVLSFLRDAGVVGSTVDFHQFVTVFSRLESW